MRFAAVTCSCLVLALSSLVAPAADLVRLTPDNWDEYAPQGKEVDCIYGDLVLRNDRLVAVVANPIAGRHANMTVRDVGGSIIDLTRREPQSDQLGAFYPGARLFSLRWSGAGVGAAAPAAQVDPDGLDLHGHEVVLRLTSEAIEGKPTMTVAYVLADGWNAVRVRTTFSNPGSLPLEVELVDSMRADHSFEKTPDGETSLYWAYDEWFGQAYGVLADARRLASVSDTRTSTLRYLADGKSTVSLAAGQEAEFSRAVFPGADLLDVMAVADELQGGSPARRSIAVRDTSGAAVADAGVVLLNDGARYAWGRTRADGLLAFSLPVQALGGKWQATVSALGNDPKTVDLALSDSPKVEIEVLQPGWVSAEIVDQLGHPVPCKTQFRGALGTPDPFLGPDSGEHAVRNVHYSHNGRFRQALPPGKYDVIVSCGPEYDAVFTQLEVARGLDSPLEAVLLRSVSTPGWVSSDFHGHASPSGDNTSSQLGRVLNLLCEHIEFAPCTEHNRISTYVPHLERLDARGRMATCSGIELTGSVLPVNHQNAFPLAEHARTQDGGAPVTDDSPELQIERLALWDGGSDKLVQENHPDIGQVFFDRDGNGEPDGGFAKMFGYMDVIEVHPPGRILDGAHVEYNGRQYNNTIFNWLQLLNQGYRIPGVVNTDAHYNFHGSGFLRNYLKSPTDDPGGIDALDMVHAAEQGHVIMTNGPFLEVSLEAPASNGNSQAIPGDEVSAAGGKALLRVRVQCANWLDIDRVQVLLNGRPAEDLNFTRQTTPERFSKDVVRFQQELPLNLTADTHVIVATLGEKSTLGAVMGPTHGQDKPVAVSNPIFVDVDGGGFHVNGDTLGAALPVTGALAGTIQCAVKRRW